MRAIALGAWDNLGRTGGEYPHLGRLFDFDPESTVAGPHGGRRHRTLPGLRDDGKPGIIFSAHLGNWELPAICAARFGLDATAVFRAPNDPAIARVLHEIRAETMGGLEAARQGAAFAMQGALEKGGHLGHAHRPAFHPRRDRRFHGPPGAGQPDPRKIRPPLRLPGPRGARHPPAESSLPPQLTPALDLPRDPDGQINVQGAMQAMTGVVEEWVREYPDAMAVDASALARACRTRDSTASSPPKGIVKPGHFKLNVSSPQALISCSMRPSWCPV